MYKSQKACEVIVQIMQMLNCLPQPERETSLGSLSTAVFYQNKIFIILNILTVDCFIPIIKIDKVNLPRSSA